MNHVYLLAEDDSDTQLLLKRAFDKAGLDFGLRFVSDGEQALDYLVGRSQFSDRLEFPFPAILLLDFNTPKLKGLEVFRTIRVDAKIKRLVVVKLSSSVNENEIEKAFESGVNSYVEKPTDFLQLIQTVVCLNQYWFGYNHFPHSSNGIVRPQKRHRRGLEQEGSSNAKTG
jgi:CheY-like chemotaxis protein